MNAKKCYDRYCKAIGLAARKQKGERLEAREIEEARQLLSDLKMVVEAGNECALMLPSSRFVAFTVSFIGGLALWVLLLSYTTFVLARIGVDIDALPDTIMMVVGVGEMFAAFLAAGFAVFNTAKARFREKVDDLEEVIRQLSDSNVSAPSTEERG